MLMITLYKTANKIILCTVLLCFRTNNFLFIFSYLTFHCIRPWSLYPSYSRPSLHMILKDQCAMLMVTTISWDNSGQSNIRSQWKKSIFLWKNSNSFTNRDFPNVLLHKCFFKALGKLKSWKHFQSANQFEQLRLQDHMLDFTFFAFCQKETCNTPKLGKDLQSKIVDTPS